MQISLLYKIQENINSVVAVAYLMPLFLIKLNFCKQIVFFFTKHKEFLKHEELRLNKKHIKVSCTMHMSLMDRCLTTLIKGTVSKKTRYGT